MTAPTYPTSFRLLASHRGPAARTVVSISASSSTASVRARRPLRLLGSIVSMQLLLQQVHGVGMVALAQVQNFEAGATMPVGSVQP